MKKKIILIVAAVLLVALGSVWAGNENRTGTAGATELLIPVGARGSAMGGSVVANSYGIDALYWNPAGLAWLEGSEATFTYLPYIADIDVTYFAFGKTFDEFGSVAFSAKVVNIGEIEETTESFPDGTGNIFSPTMAVLGLTYARALTTQVNFGASAHYIREDIHDVTANGLSFDFGFTFEPRWHGITLGLVMKNYGPKDMVFDGPGFDRQVDNRPVSSTNAKSELPTSINLGVAYNFVNQGMNSATLSGNFRSNNQSEDLWQGGLEYVYSEKYALRAGYNFSANDPSDEYLYGFSLGGGLKFDLGSTNLAFDYSWTETQVFSDNQYFTLTASF